MKILNPIKLLLVLTMLAVGFSSCEEDDETIYDYLIGRTWVGSLGFAVGPYDVESGVTFKGNEYAIDEQYYYGDVISGLWSGLSSVGNQRSVYHRTFPLW